jgi:hypothetical protein
VCRIHHCLFLCKPDEKCVLHSWYVAVSCHSGGNLEKSGKMKAITTLTCFLVSSLPSRSACTTLTQPMTLTARESRHKSPFACSLQRCNRSFRELWRQPGVTWDCDVKTQLTTANRRRHRGTSQWYKSEVHETAFEHTSRLGDPSLILKAGYEHRHGHRMKVSENRAPRRICGPKRVEVIEKWAETA